MMHRVHVLAQFAMFSALCCSPEAASAATIVGEAEVALPLGQFMAAKMTINDTTTRFELTGPDYSFFAVGFDTTTMFGYSLIIEGTDGDRTAVEQNLLGVGNPGGPQPTQNINLVSTTHDSASDLTTIVLERANNTGDSDDPVFTTSMTELDLIYAYDSSASPEFPNPFLSYHGYEGRGFGTIAFSPIPEPATATFTAIAGAVALSVARGRRR